MAMAYLFLSLILVMLIVLWRGRFPERSELGHVLAYILIALHVLALIVVAL